MGVIKALDLRRTCMPGAKPGKVMKGDLQVYRNINGLQNAEMHAEYLKQQGCFQAERRPIIHRTMVKMPKTCLLYT